MMEPDIQPTGKLRNIQIFVSLLAALFIVITILPESHAIGNISRYLLFHNVVETFSIVVSSLVFAVGWNSYSDERPGNMVFLSCAFLVVGVLDLGHMLSYKVLPDMFVENMQKTSINFWLAARLVASSSLLIVAVRPWKPFASSFTRFWLLAGALLGVAVSYAVFIIYRYELPEMFVEGKGVTALKIGLEFLIVAITVPGAVIFYRLAKHDSTYDTPALFAASAITVLSELCFAFYLESADTFNFFGHIFKFLAYAFIYRAIFVDSVRKPYETLRKSRNELRASEQKYRALFESMSDGVSVYDAETTKFEEVNKSFLDMTGYAREDICKLSVFDLSADPERTRELIKNMENSVHGENGGENPRECLIKDKNGNQLHVEISVSSYVSGKRLKIIGVIRNIGERKSMERKIFDALEFNRKIIFASPTGIAAYDSTGQCILANEALAKIVGGTQEQIQRQNYNSIRSWKEKGLFDAARETFVNKTITRKEVYISESTYGKELWVDCTLIHFKLQDQDNLLLFVEDRLDHKKAEKSLREKNELLEKIFNVTHYSIAILDKNFNFISVNKTYADACEHSPDYFPGKNHFDLFPHDENKAIFQKVVDTKEPFTIYAKPFIFPDDPDEKVTYWDWTLRPVLDETGEVEMLVFILVDVTQKVIAEEKENLRTWQLIQADRLKSLGTLVAGVAHEINNPNGFIMLNISILDDVWNSILPMLEKRYSEEGDFLVNKMPFSRTREMIPKLTKDILEGSRRISHIVDKLRDFSCQSPSDKRELVLINDVIDKATSLIECLIKKSTTRFFRELAENLPPIKGNFYELEQVLVNTISNACQALQSQEKSIRVKTSLAPTGDMVMVEVVDEGTGIHDDDIGRIIDPFFTTKRDKGGTGLGLSISHEIINAHGGTLKIFSEYGKGTSVTINLPVAGNNYKRG